MLQGLLVTAVVINSLVLLAVIVVGSLVIKRLGRVVDAAEDTIKNVNEELAPAIRTANDTLRTAQDTLKSVDTLSNKAAEELYRVDDILVSITRFIKGVTVADTVVKAVKSSQTTAGSVLAGIKEALRAFRSPASRSKEE